MSAKQYFRQLKKLESRIKSDKQMAQCFREMAEGMSSPTISDMPKGENTDQSPMLTYLTKAWNLEESIKEKEMQLQRLRVLTFELIESIENEDYRMILARRYLQNDSFRVIARELFYSERWVYKLHCRALQEFENKLNQKEFSIVQSSSV